MQNGIKLNKFKYFIAKMDRYDIFRGFFICLSIFYIFSPKQYLVRDQAIFFGNCYVLNFEFVFQVTMIFKGKLFYKSKKISMSDERS